MFVFKKELLQRPKEFRISLCVTAALPGWLMVRKHIIRQFANCKDHEYVCLLYLLEDVVPQGDWVEQDVGVDVCDFAPHLAMLYG